VCYRRPDVYHAHPEPWPQRHTDSLAALYGGRVVLCGSETDTAHAGYIEGAVRTGARGAEAVRDAAAACRAA
jgi:monoamine oxidase